MPVKRCFLWLLCWSAWIGLCSAAEVDYFRDIKPIFTARCVACHGTLQQQAGLRLDAGQLVALGSADGPVIVPGNPDASRLLARVGAADEAERMPPEGAPLTPEQIALLRAWIESGAAAPEEEVPPSPFEHWSYRPPVRAPLPVVAQPSSGHPLDAFIDAELQARGLAPLPAAEKHVLLRRVYLDLIGLPPTVAELQAFLADESPDAYERVVDRLLASPLHAERWARHWMDVWRYSDWSGYGAEVRYSQPHIWRWRDWIVDALDADKPYDRMIQEMLAGDELAPDDPQVVRATGYLVRNWYKFNRNVWIEATVEHTAKAFLGTTLNCARCHEHKYDPIAQHEYYQVRAFFEPHDVRTDRVAGQADTAADGLVLAYDANAGAPTYVFARGDEKNPLTDQPLTPALPAILAELPLEIQPVALPPAAYYPGLRPYVQTETLAQAQTALEQAGQAAQTAAAALAAAEALPVAAHDAPAVAPPTAWLEDDFSVERADLWEVGEGDWSYESGRLVQRAVGGQERRLRSHGTHPQDVRLELTYRPLGGEQWKSAGIAFDDDGAGRADGVYLSAYAGGPKVQVYHARGGGTTYPAEGARPFDVQLNRAYALRVDVAGQLVNVYVDGQFVLAYRLAEPRAAGRLSVWTFDCQAELDHFSATPLPTDAVLVDPAGQPAALAAPDLAALRATAESTAATQRPAEANLAAVAARIAADNARYAQPPAADAQELIAAAGAAQARYNHALAQEGLLKAQQALAAAQQALDPANAATQEALTQAEQALNAAVQQLATTEAALASPPAEYPPLGPVYPAQSSGRRLALARAIANPANPLTARVAVNHIWLRHFGQALVPTVFDFGHNGKPPTHPALLDWLAVEFMEHGWSMKHLHRLIVTSAAYRRASHARDLVAANAQIDPDNVYYWRMRARRMEAEAVRDSLLYLGDSLDPTRGGPDLDHLQGETIPRRSLYFRHAYEKQMLMLSLFDGANENECYRRSESIVPQQALALANSGLSLQQARKIAARLAATAPEAGAFVAAAFEMVLCRGATAAEQQACAEFLAQQAALLADPAALAPIATGPANTIKPAADPAQRARENLVHVLLNHHDFVTIH